MHCDAAFAVRSEFGGPLVNNGLTPAIERLVSSGLFRGSAAVMSWKSFPTRPPLPG